MTWTADPRELLRADEGFDLSTLDRRSTPGWEEGKLAGQAFTDERGSLLDELQERLFAEGRTGGKRSVLCIVQGLDTAGKGGIARHVMSYVDPQGVSLRAFGVPTEEERSHHYLWRIRKALPQPGLIGVFDRSHYEDVLVVRVDELVEREVWQKRYAEINRFEQQLVEAGTTVLKFAMMISHEEQGVRLMQRLDRPDKRWKYSMSDLKTRAQWNAYQDAYQAVFDLTSTDAAPWYVLPADHKWYARLAVTEILTRTLIEMNFEWPIPRWRPDAQRRRLAATMSTAALRESYDDTEAVVTSAMEKSVEVRRTASDIIDPDDRMAAARIKQRRAEWAADLAGTMAQKRAILAEREGRPDPAAVQKVREA